MLLLQSYFLYLSSMFWGDLTHHLLRSKIKIRFQSAYILFYAYIYYQNYNNNKHNIMQISTSASMNPKTRGV